MAAKQLDETNFEETIERGIVLIDWWAPWCGPCRAFAPIYEAARTRHPDVTFAQINTDEQQRLSASAAIRSIPTLMAFRDGVLLFEQAGILPGEALDELIRRVRAIDMDEVEQRLAASTR